MTVEFTKKTVVRSAGSQVIRLHLKDSDDLNDTAKFQYNKVIGYDNSDVFVMSKSFKTNAALQQHCVQEEVADAIAAAVQPIVDALPNGQLPLDVVEYPMDLLPGQVAMLPPPPPPVTAVIQVQNPPNDQAPSTSTFTMSSDDPSGPSGSRSINPENSIDLSVQTTNTQMTQ